MKELKVTITGTAPLLMHRFPLEEVKGITKMTPAEVAEIGAYRNKDGELYIPGINLWRALIAGAAYSKGKGRSTLAKTACACMLVKEQELLLHTKTYEIDTRSVVNPSTGGRILSHRPRLDSWALTATITYDNEYLSEADIKKFVADTGAKVGLGDFRPERRGFFGKFVLA